VKSKFTLAVALAAAIGLSIAHAQTPGSGTIVLKIPADAAVVISGTKTMQKGSVRTFYTPDLLPGWKYQYEVTVTWTEGGKAQKRTEWIDVIPGKTTNLDWIVAAKKVDGKKKDDVKDKKDDVKKKDEGKDKKDAKKDDGKDKKKDDVKKKDEGKDKKDAKKDDGKDKKDDVKKLDDKGFMPIFNGRDMTGLKVHVLGKKDKDVKNPFEVKDGVIQVSGSPNGYFYTDKSFKNYIVRFDWKFLKNGNSGLLVHIQGHGGGWPKSVEVQGQQTDHGRIFAIGGAKGDFKSDKKAQKDAIKMGEWNTTEVVSENGKLTARINGVEVSSGQGDLMEGPLGWQSEGAPLQFKNIRIQVLD